MPEAVGRTLALGKQLGVSRGARPAAGSMEKVLGAWVWACERRATMLQYRPCRNT